MKLLTLAKNKIFSRLTCRSNEPNHLDGYLELKAKISLLEGLLARANAFHHLQTMPSHAVKTTTPEIAVNETLIKRIIAFYAASASSRSVAGESQWSGFLNNFNLAIHQALVKNDAIAVSQALSNPAQNNLFYGFENIRIEYTHECIENKNNTCQWYAEQIHDCLLRLAEAVGVVPISNPEAPSSNVSAPLQAEAILSRLDEHFGFRIDFPNPYPDEFGLATERGVAGYRAIHALWQAWRLQSQLSNPATSHVLEIGAGLGRTAYYAKKFNVGRYSIVDIPFTAISSTHFLATTLGDEEVHLFGEVKNNSSIQIMPPQVFLESKDHFDLIVNFDSFTEIDRTMATLYWDHIFKCSKVFLSINHEANPFRVADFYTGHQRQYKVERFPCWLRRGYVEEVVRLAANEQS